MRRQAGLEAGSSVAMKVIPVSAAFVCGFMVAVLAGRPALALDEPQAQAALAPLAPVDGGTNPLGATRKFKSAGDAFRTGIRDYNAGAKDKAVDALQYAATQGHTVSMWKLGQMYAKGDGVDHDDLRAFEYFSMIADRYADENPDSQQARFVSSAFVAVGGYFLQGIEGTYVKADIGRAVDMFQYAASYYGDPDGQYSLARLYLEGQGVPKDPRQAARWLKLAASKGHHEAQALLGNLLVTGQGVPKQPGLGLMWLTLARDATDADKDSWINDLYDKNIASASDSDRKLALGYLEQYIRKNQ